MRKFIVPAVLLLALAATPGRADEGSIPIFSQTTITEPGHYVVTRDFSYATGYGVAIQADNVTLDLNGHTITGPACSSSEAGIQIHTFFATQGIIIRNGRVMSGCYGITAFSNSRVSVRIERVEVGGSGLQGISMTAVESVELLNCYVHDVASFYGINLRGKTGAFTGRILDNTVERVATTGILIDGLVAGEVRRNVVTDYGSVAAGHNGINLLADVSTWGAGGNIVEGNTVTALPSGTDDDGIRVNDTSPDNLILNNVVKGCRYGILSYADGTRIERNVVNNNSLHGIQVGSGSTGAYNHVEENQANGNLGGASCGISFANGNGHTFRNNNLRNNTLPGACGGTSGTNTDGGGNIQ